MMVTLPVDFVATNAPGYFWNVKEKKLYSIKVTGLLKPLAFHKGGTFYGVSHKPGYQISIRGRKRTLTLDYLNSLQPTAKWEQIGLYDV
jgi:hypothetical protein